MTILGSGLLTSGSSGGAPTTDPYFSNVQLLLNFQGANNSTSFTDLSNNNYSITVGGNAKISTAQSAFGTSSALSDGSGDYLKVVGNSNLQLANKTFTLEFLLYPTTPIGVYPSIFDSRNTLAAKGYAIYIDHTDNRVHALFGDSNTSSWNLEFNSVDAISTSSFIYYAITKEPNSTNPATHSDWKFYVGGVLKNSRLNILNFVVDDDTELYISGYRINNGNFNGYNGGVRLTTGVVRNVSAIPSAPFPTS